MYLKKFHPRTNNQSFRLSLTCANEQSPHSILKVKFIFCGDYSTGQGMSKLLEIQWKLPIADILNSGHVLSSRQYVLVPNLTIFFKLPPNSGHHSTMDKFFKTRGCPLSRTFTVLSSLCSYIISVSSISSVFEIGLFPAKYDLESGIL